MLSGLCIDESMHESRHLGYITAPTKHNSRLKRSGKAGCKCCLRYLVLVLALINTV